MLDLMIVARHGALWHKAIHFFAPDDGSEPIIWVNQGNCLLVWHPALSCPVQMPDISIGDAAHFARTVALMRPQLREVVGRCIEAIGVPPGFYSDLPEIARKLRVGDTSWVNVATEDDDKAAGWPSS